MSWRAGPPHCPITPTPNRVDAAVRTNCVFPPPYFSSFLFLLQLEDPLPDYDSKDEDDDGDVHVDVGERVGGGRGGGDDGGGVVPGRRAAAGRAAGAPPAVAVAARAAGRRGGAARVEAAAGLGQALLAEGLLLEGKNDKPSDDLTLTLNFTHDFIERTPEKEITSA